MNVLVKERLVKYFMVACFKSLAREIGTGRELAVKLELIERKHSLLKIEAVVYKIFEGEQGFPRLYWSGSEGDYNVIVLELLGPSLENLLQLCGGKFSVSTAFELGQQMVTSITNQLARKN